MCTMKSVLCLLAALAFAAALPAPDPQRQRNRFLPVVHAPDYPEVSSDSAEKQSPPQRNSAPDHQQRPNFQSGDFFRPSFPWDDLDHFDSESRAYGASLPNAYHLPSQYEDVNIN